MLWQVPKPVAGATHAFKYRLAYVVDNVCVVRYDNEVGKGDHRHIDEKESVYTFTAPDALIAEVTLMAFMVILQDRHARNVGASRRGEPPPL